MQLKAHRLDYVFNRRVTQRFVIRPTTFSRDTRYNFLLSRVKQNAMPSRQGIEYVWTTHAPEDGILRYDPKCGAAVIILDHTSSTILHFCHHLLTSNAIGITTYPCGFGHR